MTTLDGYFVKKKFKLYLEFWVLSPEFYVQSAKNWFLRENGKLWVTLEIFGRVLLITS